MRPDLTVDPPGMTRNGFGDAAFEAPPPRCEPLRGGGDDGPAGEAAEQIKAAKAFVSRTRRRRLDAAALASGVDALALREGEAKRSEA